MKLNLSLFSLYSSLFKYNFKLFFIFLNILIFFISSTSSSSSYQPRQSVIRLHNLPHLNTKLNEVNNKFDITTSSLTNTYTQSLLIFPIILGSIGIILLLFYLFGLLFSCCFKCCNCNPLTRKNNPQIDKRNLTILFFSCMIVILSFDLTVLSGNASISRGVGRGKLNKLYDFIIFIYSKHYFILCYI